MKKLAILLIVCLLLTLVGCGNKDGTASEGNLPDDASTNASGVITDTAKPETKNGVVEITEKLFIGQLNDIYLNQKNYLGKTIKYEGMFTQYTWEAKNITYYSVYRNSPGCCGADGQAGFEVIWADDAGRTYPKENDWCEVVGTLESYDEEGQTYLRIRLDSLTVKIERGLEFVSQ